VLLRMVEGNRPCVGPARRWSDDIIDWCGCCLLEAAQLANNEQKWRVITGLNSSHGPWV